MKTLVMYYSKSGSNKFLSEKISKQLECDIEEIKPRLDQRVLINKGMMQTL